MEESLMFKVAVVDFLIKRLVFEIPAVHPLDPSWRNNIFKDLLAIGFSYFGGHGLVGTFDLANLMRRRVRSPEEVKIPRRLLAEPTNEVIRSWYSGNVSAS
eukprot:TRINITY_DN5213_c0_g6_i2.p1 TRINITY_DN5213_c0_g6~~TRINITY_DN5213_c0_g6_i2.p1  ORF type:complete len:101 (+),score=26.64 TRINITY_DN5213_c0_g6_i2:195-497(+)